NGEVYNYRELGAELKAIGHQLTSTGDTDVVVHAWAEWGVDCVTKLRGMFAFAVWDRSEHKLWLVRDRVGIKPLYYARLGDTLIFASEIKAFYRHPAYKAAIRPEAVAQYLSFTHPIDQDGTWIEGVKRLPPGSHAEVSPGNEPKVTLWWDPVDLYCNRREPQ